MELVHNMIQNNNFSSTIMADAKCTCLIRICTCCVISLIVEYKAKIENGGKKMVDDPKQLPKICGIDLGQNFVFVFKKENLGQRGNYAIRFNCSFSSR